MNKLRFNKWQCEPRFQYSWGLEQSHWYSLRSPASYIWYVKGRKLGKLSYDGREPGEAHENEDPLSAQSAVGRRKGNRHCRSRPKNSQSTNTSSEDAHQSGEWNTATPPIDRHIAGKIFFLHDPYTSPIMQSAHSIQLQISQTSKMISRGSCKLDYERFNIPQT